MGCACSSSRESSPEDDEHVVHDSQRRAPATHGDRRRSLDVFHDAFASFRDSFRTFRSPAHAHWTETACAWLDVRAKTYLDDKTLFLYSLANEHDPVQALAMFLDSM